MSLLPEQATTPQTSPTLPVSATYLMPSPKFRSSGPKSVLSIHCGQEQLVSACAEGVDVVRTMQVALESVACTVFDGLRPAVSAIAARQHVGKIVVRL